MLEPKKQPFSARQKPFFFRTFPYLLLSKATLFHLKHRKFPPSHNLLSTKEHGCSFNLRSNSLRCSARTSHRFKAFSPPFCAKKRFRLVPPENFAKIFFGRALNRPRSPEDRNPRRVFAVLFARRKKYQSVSLTGTLEVFQTSIQLAQTTTSH